MSRSFFKGASYAVAGLKMITRPRLRRFVIFPFLINTILFSTVLWFGSGWLDNLIDQWLPDWLSWLEYIIWPVLALLALAVIFSTFTLFANLLGAPFNSMLAEVVEMRLSGKNSVKNQNPSSIAKEIAVSLQSEIGKLLFFGLRAIPLLLLFLIPGLNLLAPFLWFLFSAWMLAHEYMDYPMSNHGCHFSKGRIILKNKRMLVLGFGLIVMIMTLIPILNFIAMPAAVAGASIMWHEQFTREQEQLSAIQ